MPAVLVAKPSNIGRRQLRSGYLAAPEHHELLRRITAAVLRLVVFWRKVS
jgi:hypothetical protein